MRTDGEPDLQLVSGRRTRKAPEAKASVATQAVFAGWIDHRTTGMTADATGRGHGVISIRVGRILLYLEDRQALETWLDAFREAEDLADAVYGPVLPPPVYRPRK